MYKLPLSVILFLSACFATSVLSAQPFFASPKNTPSAPASSDSAVLTPSEFKSKVNTLGRQAQQDMLQRGQIAAKNQTNQLSPPNPHSFSSPKSTPPAPASPEKQTAPTPIHPPLPENKELPDDSFPVAPPAAPLPPAPQPNTINKGESIEPGPIAPEQQNQVYTGFGTQNENNNSSSNTQSSGWNIKY